MADIMPGWLVAELEVRDVHDARLWLVRQDYGGHQNTVAQLIRGCGHIGIIAAMEATYPGGWHGFRADQTATRAGCDAPPG